MPRINFQVSPSDYEIVDRAARLAGKSISQFVEAVALSSACASLAERRYFVLSQAEFGRFQAQLDDPRPPTEQLCRCMQTPLEKLDQ